MNECLTTSHSSVVSVVRTVQSYSASPSPLPYLYVYRVPQLLTRLVRSERVLHLLLYISKAHPQAVYFPIRTLYLTLKKEQKEKSMRALCHTYTSTQTHECVHITYLCTCTCYHGILHYPFPLRMYLALSQ